MAAALAELLLEHYPGEQAKALEHLDFAIAELREMKMQPSLEPARRHTEPGAAQQAGEHQHDC